MSLIFKVPDDAGGLQEIELHNLNEEQAIGLFGSVRTSTGQINARLLLRMLLQNRIRGSEQDLKKYANSIGNKLFDVEVSQVLENPTGVTIETQHLGIVARHTFRRLSVSEMFELLKTARSGCPHGVPRKQWLNLRALDGQWRRFLRESDGYEGRQIPLLVRAHAVGKLGEVESQLATSTGVVQWNPK